MAHGEWPKTTICKQCGHHAFDYEHVATDPRLGPFTGFGHGFGGDQPCKCGCKILQVLPLDIMSQPTLIAMVEKLQAGIRKHRDTKGHNRCWENDLELYRLLPETPPESPELPSRAEFMEECRVYYEGQAGIVYCCLCGEEIPPEGRRWKGYSGPNSPAHESCHKRVMANAPKQHNAPGNKEPKEPTPPS